MNGFRRSIQAFFLAVVLFGVFAVKGNAEWWCPFGGVEAIYTYLREGNMPCSLAVSNLYVLAAVCAMTLLVRRAFCGYVCPIGTLSEWLRTPGKRLGMAVRVPERLDRALSLLKYPLLALILFFTYRMGELWFRGFDPCYALISRHGEDITFWAYAVLAGIALASVPLSVPFCRWLCPLAAVLNPISRFGIGRIRRNEDACLDCGRCAASCPMEIPVDRVFEVAHARCTSCFQCAIDCPAPEKNALVWGVPGRSVRCRPSAVACIVFLCLGTAVWAARMYPLPAFVQNRGDAPETLESVDLRIGNLTCRGRANLLWYYLGRDDFSAIPGYLKLEAWPEPGKAKARITYDPSSTDGRSIREAIAEPYFDASANFWRPSPFEIEGYGTDPEGFPE